MDVLWRWVLLQILCSKNVPLCVYGEEFNLKFDLYTLFQSFFACFYSMFPLAIALLILWKKLTHFLLVSLVLILHECVLNFMV